MTIGAETNEIWIEVVGQALDYEIDQLRHGEKFFDRRAAWLFGSDAAVLVELERLRDLNLAKAHFDVGPYHNVLLQAVAPPFMESMNYRDEPLEFCGGRYRVRSLDVAEFEGAFFEDNDFEWPAELVNVMSTTSKEKLGLDDRVFGVANRLRPSAEDLRVVEVPAAGCVRPIRAFTADVERETRRRMEAGSELVLSWLLDPGPLYLRDAEFPFVPAWAQG